MTNPFSSDTYEIIVSDLFTPEAKGCVCVWERAQAAEIQREKKNYLSKFRVLLNQTLYTCHKKDRKKEKGGEREGGNGSSLFQKIVLVSVMLCIKSSLKRQVTVI